ncbi:MAG: glycoside hydrolase family 3 N-terminal domain-containing protein [Pyrinomonadaceae bacterium]
MGRWNTMLKLVSVVALLTLPALGVTNGLAQVAAPGNASDTAAVERRVESILNKMTLEEKIDMLGGVDGFFIRDISRLGLPRLKMADGPMGVRNFGRATAMPGGIGLAATWNVALAERVGTELGRDAREGVHFLLGPGVNIYRAPMNGRNFEYFGEDPYLASRVAVGYIKGVQSQGVSATIKHFMANNDNRAFSYYDVNGKQWRADSGDYDVFVGRSSEQIELRGKVTLGAVASVNARRQ